MKVATRGRQAVVLSGGSAYAAYEVGVLRAIFGGESAGTGYLPVDGEIFSGTSAGSFNAAVLASLPDLSCLAATHRLSHIWLNDLSFRRGACETGAIRFRGNVLQMLDTECIRTDPLRPWYDLAEDATFLARDGLRRAARFAASPGRLAARLIDLFDAGALVSTAPFRRVLERTLDLAALRSSPRAFRAVATNWATGVLTTFSNADMTDRNGLDIILGSSALPGLPPVSIDGQPYADGGIQMNTPLKPAIDAGADTIHVIYLDPDVSAIPIQHLRSTVETLNKVYTIAKATILNHDLDWAAEINRGLALAAGAPGAAGGTPGDDAVTRGRVGLQVIERLRGPSPFRPLTIHRYHPRYELGEAFGLLTFERDAIADLINRGFRDGADHDCVHSECLVPDL